MMMWMSLHAQQAQHLTQGMFCRVVTTIRLSMVGHLLAVKLQALLSGAGFEDGLALDIVKIACLLVCPILITVSQR